MLFVFVKKIADTGYHIRGGKISQGAERAAEHVIADIKEQR
jgi:hypothetical protein